MGETTAISWCDHTFNPWIGCTKVSPACDGCYAEALMGEGGRYGRAAWGGPGKGEGTRVRTAPNNWKQPLTWNRKAAAEGITKFVFCASLADVFDNAVPAEWRRDLFDLIRATPHLTWLLLTKRPGNIPKLFAETITDELRAASLKAGMLGMSLWPRNAAIGCTVVNQEEADRDIPKLLHVKLGLHPAFAFVSMEPLLGPVNISRFMWPTHWHWDAKFRTPQEALAAGAFAQRKRQALVSNHAAFLDWVITGGETDQGQHKARPTHFEWISSLRDQCAAAGVPFHFKQHGAWKPICWMADGESDDLYHPPPEHDPEAIRRCKVAHTVMNRDGSLHPSAADPETYHAHHGSMLMFKVGAQRAGRLLDGQLHDARPEIRA